MLERFQHNTYTLRRKVFKIFGGAFHIFGSEGELIFFSKQKAFKIREDIRLYSDEDMTEEILWIQSRNTVDFAAAYDVIDSVNDQKVGALRREGWGSMFRDHWIIMDADDVEVGEIVEDSGMMAFLRRFMTNLIPQSFYAEVAGEHICDYKQHFNPFIYKLDIDFPTDANGFDRIIGLAGGILLAAIEGRQN